MSASDRSRLLLACAAEPQRQCNTWAAHAVHAVADGSHVQASGLLDALDVWMRRQTIEAVLPRAQAKALLNDLREDRRFWAQQRKQFAVVWESIEIGLREETRPLSKVLGADTSARLLNAVDHMDDDPMLVHAVLRSEVVERLLGHILYEGIFEFVQRADLIGNALGQLPVLGAIRMQILAAARKQLDAVLGDQLARFLGECVATRPIRSLDAARRERACLHPSTLITPAPFRAGTRRRPPSRRRASCSPMSSRIRASGHARRRRSSCSRSRLASCWRSPTWRWC